MTVQNSNIPSPDPSLATNERLAMAVATMDGRIERNMKQCREWVESLQVLHEEKIRGAEDKTESLDRVVQTRLAGSETALNAAMAAADKVTQKIEINFGAVMNEMKAGMTKQMDTIKEGIDDLKGRLDRGEGLSKGSIDSVVERRTLAGLAHGANQNWIAIAALAAAVAGWLYTATRPSPLAPAVVYAQPSGALSTEPRVQRQSFPLAPSWDDPIHRVSN